MEVLILTGRFGQENRGAAQALRQQIAARLPQRHIISVDLWQQAWKGSGSRRLSQFFDAMARRGTPVCDKLSGGLEQRFPPARQLLIRAIGRLMEQYRPQVVISTLPLYTQMAAEYKQRGACYTLVSCVTDISCHSRWIAPGVDLYCVASAYTARMLCQWGVAQEQILITGLPAHPAFRVPAAGQRQPGHILVMGGGPRPASAEREFYRGLAAIPGAHVTVMAGENKALSHKRQGWEENLHILEGRENLDHLMPQCDLLVSKPTGDAVFKAVACGLPLLTFAPKTEEEKATAAFVRQQGIGLVLPQGRQTSCWIVEDLLLARCRLEEMRRQAIRLQTGYGLDALWARLGWPQQRRSAGD